MIETVLMWIAAYVMGSIPSGLWIGKYLYRTDLRTAGSRNTGATNAYRILGAKAAILVFFADFFKGFAAVALGDPDPLRMVGCAAFAVIGHMWSVFMGFHGGRGVATGVGVFAYLSPVAALSAFLVWALMVAWKQIVSLASIVAALVPPLVVWWRGEPWEYAVFGAIGSVLVIAKHRDNIVRLWRGEESLIQRGKK